MSVSVCLYVGLHTDLCLIFAEFRAAYGRGSILLWRRCDTLCTSGFMDNVMSAHIGHLRRRKNVVYSVTHQGAARI